MKKLLDRLPRLSVRFVQSSGSVKRARAKVVFAWHLGELGKQLEDLRDREDRIR